MYVVGEWKSSRGHVGLKLLLKTGEGQGQGGGVQLSTVAVASQCKTRDKLLYSR